MLFEHNLARLLENVLRVPKAHCKVLHAASYPHLLLWPSKPHDNRFSDLICSFDSGEDILLMMTFHVENWDFISQGIQGQKATYPMCITSNCYLLVVMAQRIRNYLAWINLFDIHCMLPMDQRSENIDFPDFLWIVLEVSLLRHKFLWNHIGSVVLFHDSIN